MPQPPTNNDDGDGDGEHEHDGNDEQAGKKRSTAMTRPHRTTSRSGSSGSSTEKRNDANSKSKRNHRREKSSPTRQDAESDGSCAVTAAAQSSPSRRGRRGPLSAAGTGGNVPVGDGSYPPPQTRATTTPRASPRSSPRRTLSQQQHPPSAPATTPSSSDRIRRRASSTVSDTGGGSNHGGGPVLRSSPTRVNSGIGSSAQQSLPSSPASWNPSTATTSAGGTSAPLNGSPRRSSPRKRRGSGGLPPSSNNLLGGGTGVAKSARLYRFAVLILACSLLTTVYVSITHHHMMHEHVAANAVLTGGLRPNGPNLMNHFVSDAAETPPLHGTHSVPVHSPHGLHHHHKKRSQLAGLDCAAHGGPSHPALLEEVIYWRDYPGDEVRVSPYARFHEGGEEQGGGGGGEEQYLTFEWPSFSSSTSSAGVSEAAETGAGAAVAAERQQAAWEADWTALESAAVLATATGRTLVVPPFAAGGGGSSAAKNGIFPLDLADAEHDGLTVITAANFLKRISSSTSAKAKAKGGSSAAAASSRGINYLPHPPKVLLASEDLSTSPQGMRAYYSYLTRISSDDSDGGGKGGVAQWDVQKCLIGIPRLPYALFRMKLDRMLRDALDSEDTNSDGNAGADANGKEDEGGHTEAANKKDVLAKFVHHPTPADADPILRLGEALAGRREVCLYDEALWDAPVLHLSADHASSLPTPEADAGNDANALALANAPTSSSPLSVPFYSSLFHESHRDDLWTKRFVRDHLRFPDCVQCAAARVVAGLRERATTVRAKAASAEGLVVLGGGGGHSGGFDALRLGVDSSGSEKIAEVIRHIKEEEAKRGQEEGAIEGDEIDAGDNSKEEGGGVPSVTGGVLYLSSDSGLDPLTDPTHSALISSLTKLGYKPVSLASHFQSHLGDSLSSNNNAMQSYMVDLLVSAKSEDFFGTWGSRATGRVNRLRGYHATLEADTSSAQRSPTHHASDGHGRSDEYDGSVKSYFVDAAQQHRNDGHRDQMRRYEPMRPPFTEREYPVAWRDIDKGAGATGTATYDDTGDDGSRRQHSSLELQNPGVMPELGGHEVKAWWI